MQRIIINQLGPIEHCELPINDFIICTGPQAAGKSTVAKSIFFFKNLRNILLTQFKRRIFWVGDSGVKLSYQPFQNEFFKEARLNFLQIFGSSWCMSPKMYLEYYYDPDTRIRISLRQGKESPNYIWIECSQNFKEFFKELDQIQEEHHNHFGAIEDLLKRKIKDLFHEDKEIVYIPAGRSMITLLSSQLYYIYSLMDDTQKRSLDYCTQNYLERILQIKESFTKSSEQMIEEVSMLTGRKPDKAFYNELIRLEQEILQGKYLNVNGEERLLIEDDRYIKINFASSGQQEVLWILNVLLYYVINNKNAYFIIEEPESHLFPDAQKKIAEFISLARKGGENQMLITTHSPYILGAINNLLYANKISQMVDQTKLGEIIPCRRWLPFSSVSAYFIKRGKVESCLDEEFQSIENEVIDGAAQDINDDYDQMIQLREVCSKGE